jgi:SAM-dependent methyltransferase
MLPSSFPVDGRGKEEIQRLIEAASPEERSKYVVLYEKVFHDQQAASYDGLFTDPLPARCYCKKLIASEVYEHVKRALFVVDLCCGTGKSSIPLIARGKFVVGIDISMEMLNAYAGKCLSQKNDNYLLLRADASAPPLKPGSCQAVIIIGGLHHIPRADRCISHVTTLLSPGGIVILHEPLNLGERTRLSRLLENVFALIDVTRVMRAVRRRLSKQEAPSVPAKKEEEESVFTPYERPFTSPGEVAGLFTGGAEIQIMRPQALISFLPLPPYMGERVASLVSLPLVALDHWLAKKGLIDWRDGNAVFVLARKPAQRGEETTTGGAAKPVGTRP